MFLRRVISRPLLMARGAADAVHAAVKSKLAKPPSGGIQHHQRLTLTGTVHDIQTGFLVDDPVTQFTLTTAVLKFDAGDVDPPIYPTDAKRTGDARVRERDHFTVRCFGSQAATARLELSEGTIASVTGQLRMNKQVEAGSGSRSFFFPFIAVRPDKGDSVVRVIHGKPKRASDTPVNPNQVAQGKHS